MREAIAQAGGLGRLVALSVFLSLVGLGSGSGVDVFTTGFNRVLRHSWMDFFF
jgi:hypothetical protein